MQADRTVLCVPGPWADRSEFLAAVIRADTGYVFAGGIIMHLESKAAFRLLFEGADPHIPRAFWSGGGHWRDSAAMAAIAEHRSVAYLIDEGGSRERAEALMAPAAALVKAGGLGVKVDSSGLAHSPEQWLELVENRHLFSAYRAYVVSVNGDEAYTCGMHNFGMFDVCISPSVPEAGSIASQFAWFLFTESPTIRAGHTFSPTVDGPRFRIEESDPRSYPPESLFANEFGTWQLVPLASA